MPNHPQPKLSLAPLKTPAWIAELTKKRRSNSTSVIIVESADDGRVREFIDWHKNRCATCGKATNPVVEDTATGQALYATCQDEACGRKQAGHLVMVDFTESIQLAGAGGKRTTKVYPEHLVVLTPFAGLRALVADAEKRLVEEPIRNQYWEGGDEAMPIRLIDEQLRLVYGRLKNGIPPTPAMEAAEAQRKAAEAKKKGARRGDDDEEKEEVPDPMRERRTVVVIRWPYNREDERHDAAAHLSEAILDLATDDLVLNKTKSTIVVFLEDRASLKPSAVGAAHVLTPPRSTATERARIIERSIAAYNAYARVLMLRSIEATPAQVAHLAEILGGLNLDQTHMVISECLQTRNALDVGFLSSSKAANLSNASQVKLAEKPPFGFDAIGGYEYLKAAIRRRVILPTRHPNVVTYYGGSYKPSRGILLVGPPGTGKSRFGNATAHELDLGIVELQPDTFLDKFVGESEKRTRQVLNLIRAAEPIVVWLDEVEALLKHRGKTMSTDGGVGRNVLGMLLAGLDDPRHDRRSIWIMATNRIRDVDPAILRPGRIDDVFYVGYPDELAREAIFRVHLYLCNKPPLEANIDLKELASRTPMWSGAEIEDAVRGAIRAAGEEYIEKNQPVAVGMRHLLAALRRDIDPHARIKEETALLAEVAPYVSDKEHLLAYAEGLRALKARLPEPMSEASPTREPRPDWLGNPTPAAG